MAKPGRILSGMRPTGRLHLGNYVGALENWVRLQNEGWENFHMVADWHMLTTGHEDTYTRIAMCREHYSHIGLGAAFVDQFIR